MFFQLKGLPFQTSCKVNQEVMNFVYPGKFAVTALLGDRHASYGVSAPQLFFNYSNLSILFCVLICRVSAKESTDGFYWDFFICNTLKEL